MARPFGSINALPRRDRKVVRRTLDTPCRLWQGSLEMGYGRKWVPGRGMTAVHRWVWEQVNGPIPKGMLVMHHCDHPLCYRYDHLKLATYKENSADMAAKGRHSQWFQPLHNIKLNVEQVAEMRTRAQSGERHAALGRAFGVHRSTVLRIVRGDQRKSG